jgi:hypothetical protein
MVSGSVDAPSWPKVVAAALSAGFRVGSANGVFGIMNHDHDQRPNWERGRCGWQEMLGSCAVEE